jgi:hypothetical protein
MKAPLLLAAALAVAGCAGPQSSDREKSAAGACEAREDGQVRVEDAWVRAQADASAMSAAYFTVCNGTLAPVTIEGLSTPAASLVELHETTRDANGVVSMAPTGPVTLAPGEAVVFEPGGKHAMLMSLAGPIAEGSTTGLTIELAGGDAVRTEAKAVSAADAAHQH